LTKVKKDEFSEIFAATQVEFLLMDIDEDPGKVTLARIE